MKNTSFKYELDVLKEKKNQLEAYYDFLKKKDKYEIDGLDVFQKAWNEASSNQSSLTDTGLKNMKKLTNIYTYEQIFKAIRIVWERNMEADKRFAYMCGILKNLKLEEDDPDAHFIKKEAYRVRLKLSNSMYTNDKVYWKWINDGVLASEIESIGAQCKNWTELQATIQGRYYE